MNDIERPTAGEIAEAIAELANEIDFTRGLNVYVELPGEVAEVLLAALLATQPEDVGEPTPESLCAIAEWFDDPNKSPSFGVTVGGRMMTPGMVLRLIAANYRDALRHPTKEAENG